MIYEDEAAPRQPGTLPQSGSRVQSHTTSETIEAHMRHRKPKKKLHPFDTTIELRNGDLARWDAEYLANMDTARLQKDVTKSATLAKNKARLLMLGDLDRGNRGPLSMFHGIELLSTLIGIDLHGSKRHYEDDEESQLGRRVRPRSEAPSDEAARGVQLEEDDYIPMLEDDTIEQGRKEPTPLDDHRQSSIMPWSRGGDSSHRLTFGSGYPRSVSIGGSHQGAGGPSYHHPSSRLPSASPLIGRGRLSSANIDDYPLPPASYSGGGFETGVEAEDNFELFGPAANVDTQTAAQSQWLRAVLDTESSHFLTFVREAIAEKDQLRRTSLTGAADVEEDDADDDRMGTIRFTQLLPPKEHGCIVAAQALLHVLSLGTKGVLAVEQPVDFGSIVMKVLVHADAGSESDEASHGRETQSL